MSYHLCERVRQEKRRGEEKKGGPRLLKGKGREAFKGQEGLEVGEERHVPGV